MFTPADTGGGVLALAQKVAACWADNRGISQIVFKPDGNRFRNLVRAARDAATDDHDAIARTQARRRDPARKAGIPVWRFGQGWHMRCRPVASTPGREKAILLLAESRIATHRDGFELSRQNFGRFARSCDGIADRTGNALNLGEPLREFIDRYRHCLHVLRNTLCHGTLFFNG